MTVDPSVVPGLLFLLAEFAALAAVGYVSERLYEAVEPLMSKGQFGARDLQKHLWKLPIPEFDSGDPLHVAVSRAGRVAAQGAARELAALRQNRPRLTWRIARRELRKWLRVLEEGKAVEEAVQRLL